jgi:hypothetical protein
MDRDDHWSETDIVEDLARDQIDHLLSKKRTAYNNSDEDPFPIMQWLGTQDPVTMILETSITVRALYLANPALYWSAFNAMSPDHWPTDIMQATSAW